MSESATNAVKETGEKTGDKKTRKVLTPEEIFKEQQELLKKRKLRMKSEQIQNMKSQKLMSEALLKKIAEKFNVEVDKIDFKFIDEKLSLGNSVKTPSQVDENQLRLSQVISNLFPQKSMSADDMFNEVSLWKNAYDILSNQLREYAKIQKDEYGQTHFKFTSEMIPRLQTFLKTQDTNGNNAGYYSNAMHGQRNNRTEASEEKKT